MRWRVMTVTFWGISSSGVSLFVAACVARARKGGRRPETRIVSRTGLRGASGSVSDPESESDPESDPESDRVSGSVPSPGPIAVPREA
ncbi:hypothetical protein SSA02_24950 [Swaminathania salitolerans]|uniref:Lipoprotein n=1 Tax=Swaminathania salitolerans TaxID=182838 RepID=A0A511BT98_9PROT|nr:hypothetical protein SSA02_24950 [Swaminathania salitolerans]